ncbi:MAG: PIG-L family deacetylase [Bryobacteraceae bacterium]|nr:PIG-L family deacetylase [Bryobacteraceae bacterium]
MRILALHSHPDDIEILAGGTVALLARAGHHVTMATMTCGDCGSREYGPEELSAIRREEARRAASLIGAEYVALGFKDLAIFNDDASRRRVTAAIRNARPDIVLTAAPVDYHCDHEATSSLVRDACFGVSAPNYDCSAYSDAAALDAIPHLYFMDSAASQDRDGRVIRPDFVVDVRAVFALKREMLECHESQRAWLRRQHGMADYIETMEEWTRRRGALAGIEFGEGFRQYKGHPYPETPLLQELLGSAVSTARV